MQNFLKDEKDATRTYFSGAYDQIVDEEIKKKNNISTFLFHKRKIRERENKKYLRLAIIHRFDKKRKKQRNIGAPPTKRQRDGLLQK